MFESTMIVQSAISAFNNAALAAPAFFWWALLAMPLFVMVAFYGGDFIRRIGWNNDNIASRASLVTIILTLMWVVLFGGNYGVLRDNITVLPFMVAAIVFVASVFIGSYLRNFKLPAFRGASRGRKLGIVAAWIAILGIIGLSDIHNWWGPILQVGAFLGGLAVGRLARREMRPIAGTVLIVMAVIVAILMQPEFFRFGQLGALTPVHLLFLILMSGAVAATVALRNVRPRGLIRHSAYVKLKWLGRFLSVLCMALFVLTESVPIFLGMTVMFFLMFAMSVVHADKLPDNIDVRMFAIILMLFETITTLPVISALGLVYWVILPRVNAWGQMRFLL